MSVTVHWRPVGQKNKYFEKGTSTSFDKLKRAFGSQIDDEHVASLRAMAIATDDPFYDEVADTVLRIGSIEIWGEH